MKLWLHFTRVIRKCLENGREIEEPSENDLPSSFLSDTQLSIDGENEEDDIRS